MHGAIWCGKCHWNYIPEKGKTHKCNISRANLTQEIEAHEQAIKLFRHKIGELKRKLQYGYMGK